jgi:hypothetical protein
MNCTLIVLFALLSFATAPLLAQTMSPGQTATPANEQNIAARPSLTQPVSPPAPQETEQWGVLPLAKGGLNPSVFNAVLLSKVEAADFTRELVRVQWRIGDYIELSIVRPHGVEKPPVMLYLYDYNSDTDRFRNETWCKQATQGGFAAVGFVSALSGQRYHAPRPLKEWFVSEMQEALGTSTHDVQLILNYLTARDDFNVKTVGMFGQGSGGAVAVLAAAVDPRIEAEDPRVNAVFDDIPAIRQSDFVNNFWRALQHSLTSQPFGASGCESRTVGTSAYGCELAYDLAAAEGAL